MMRRRTPPRAGRGVVGTVARTAVIAGTATAVSAGVSNSMQSKAQAQQQAQAAKAQQQAEFLEMQQQVAALQAQQTQAAVAPEPAPAAATGGATDMLAQLTQLGELRAAGILNDAEFEAAKARILAG